MSETVAHDRLSQALQTAVDHLLALRHPDGYWEGHLSSSALSTATAVSALVLARRPQDAAMIRAGIGWLIETQNADGGWGDTADSPSNLATTLLALSALTLAGETETPTLRQADRYITAQAGASPVERMAGIQRIYGTDRTFAVPILMNCALAGFVPWQGIPGLSFEMAAFPHNWYKLLRLHVVSYALPALIAIGLLLEHRTPSRNPITRLLRRRITPVVLAKLARLQPEHGGFLEATPLTAFVVMSLLARGDAEHPVVTQGLHFLRASMRPDGSWPIDTNLSVWGTTGAVTALAHAGCLARIDTEALRRWIAERQYRAVHPFTHALPGGWGWTHLPGGVPDADDTPGAMLALHQLGGHAAIQHGAAWLRQLQNSDGGWPTFCRGWGKLPFDKSSPDITAHVLRALLAHDAAGGRRAVARGFRYLAAAQRADGAWLPLWFGNQRAPEQVNAVYGTARVLLAYADNRRQDTAAHHGVHYLLQAQNPDGGWGGDRNVPSSVEETALAVTALTQFSEQPGAETAIARGTDYLLARIDDGSWQRPAPIGLYFASLWYAEALYPIIWTIDALGRVQAKRKCGAGVK